MLHGLSQWKMRSVHLWGVFPPVCCRASNSLEKLQIQHFFFFFNFIAHSTKTHDAYLVWMTSWALGCRPSSPSNFDLELILWSKRSLLDLPQREELHERGRRVEEKRMRQISECSCSPADSVHGAEARMRFVLAAGGWRGSGGALAPSPLRSHRVPPGAQRLQAGLKANTTPGDDSD